MTVIDIPTPAQNHTYALRQLTLSIQIMKTGGEPIIIMSDGAANLDMQRNADQVVRTQHGNVQIWTVVNGGCLPVKSVHAIINSYLKKDPRWKFIDLRELTVDPRAFLSYRRRHAE